MNSQDSWTYLRRNQSVFRVAPDVLLNLIIRLRTEAGFKEYQFEVGDVVDRYETDDSNQYTVIEAPAFFGINCVHRIRQINSTRELVPSVENLHLQGLNNQIYPGSTIVIDKDVVWSYLNHSNNKEEDNEPAPWLAEPVKPVVAHLDGFVRVRNKITGSSPIILHNNGHRKSSQSVNDLFGHLKTEMMSRDYRPLTPANVTFNVFTCSTYERRGCFAETCDKFGVDVWRRAHALSTPFNFYSKLQMIHDHASSIDAEYLLCCDTDDVIVLQSPQEALQRYMNMFKVSDVVLFNAERKHYPPSCPTQKFELTQYPAHLRENSDTPSVFTFLNAGCFIGRTKTITRLISAALAHLDEAYEDQSIWKLMHWRHPEHIRIDYMCRIFQCMQYDGDVSDFLVQE